MALCEKCKTNPATVQIIQIVNGQKYQRILCAKCAQEENLFSVGGQNSLFQTPAWVLHATGRNNTNPGSRKCQTCGTTYADFLKTGFLGCPKCYEEFKDLLQPTIRRIQHGNEIHRGMRPSVSADVHSEGETAPDPVAALRAQLEEAVAREEYELAAQLRDEIRALTKEGNGNEQ